MAELTTMNDPEKPLVSVICISYNHRNFVESALNSVLLQDYPNIEMIVVDDASTDGSGEFIQEYCLAKGIRYILNSENKGNCISFNNAFNQCNGKFIIDFAADDILMPARVSEGVKELSNHEPEYGIHYSNAMIIDEEDRELGLHSDLTKTIARGEKMPEGMIFAQILERYFICPPTIMARREVFEYLGGYDETLSFEDFDFIVRSSRKYKFCYSPEVLVRRRIVRNSKSQLQYRKGSKDLWSVLAVCEKAQRLVRTRKERKSLDSRLQYECRQVIIHNEMEIVERYLQLMKKNGMSGITRGLYRITSRIYPMVFRMV